MDEDLEELKTILFPNYTSDYWKNKDGISDYIIHLASCGVDKLGREGGHLKEEKLEVLNQTKELAFSNYKTFIHTADCSKEIYKDFTGIEHHLESLCTGIPVLKDKIEEFLSRSKALSHSRHSTSLTLSKHTQLLEILELPQLMDTCVRNGYYDESLEILSYVKRLEKKHSDMPIITGIVTEIQSGTKLMVSQLLSQLRSSLTLPQCLKVIGLLRRLDVFTEAELRLKFLMARDTWFSGIIRNIPRDDAYFHISKVVEASRVHLFDIVTQYRAIFSDDDIRYPSGDSEINEPAIFQGWILQKVNQFLSILETDLNRGVGTNLESVLAQCMFFGQSFSRIGADFRTILIPLFQKAALSQFEAAVRAANIKFDESLSCFSLMEASSSMISPTFLAETQDKTQPPLALMEFLPLAHYMNGLVAAFNGLRQCCPLAVLKDVLDVLEKSLAKVVMALTELHHMESSGFTEKEEKSFNRMCLLLMNSLIPHINGCLQYLFPLSRLAVLSGIPATKLQREKFGTLDASRITSSLESVLPQREKVQVDSSEVSEEVKESEEDSVHPEPEAGEEQPLIQGDSDAVDSVEETVSSDSVLSERATETAIASSDSVLAERASEMAIASSDSVLAERASETAIASSDSVLVERASETAIASSDSVLDERASETAIASAQLPGEGDAETAATPQTTEGTS